MSLEETARFELAGPFRNLNLSRVVQSTGLCHVSMNLAERQGVEPCGRLSTTYGLAIRCITVLPTLHCFGAPCRNRTNAGRLQGGCTTFMLIGRRLAGTVRFELTGPFRSRCFSRALQSTTLPHPLLFDTIPRLVCVQLRITVAAYESKILYSVIVVDAIDMVKNEWHRFSIPLWTNPATSTTICKQTLREDSLLDKMPSVCAVCNKHLV